MRTDFENMTCAEADAAIAQLSDTFRLDQHLLDLKRTDPMYSTLVQAVLRSGIPVYCRDRAMIVLLVEQNKRWRDAAVKRFSNQIPIAIIKSPDAQQSDSAESR